MLTIPIEKFDAYRIQRTCEIVINFQNFRSFLNFADRCGDMSVNVHFEGPSKPMIIAVEENIDFRFLFYFYITSPDMRQRFENMFNFVTFSNKYISNK